MDISAATATASGVDLTGQGKEMSGLTTEDFLEMLITELTHQDPFEPVKNADLMNQIGSIRTLEMNDRLAETLDSVASRTGELSQTMNAMMLQSNLNAAHAVVGKLVSGITADDQRTAGEVVSVRVADGEVILRLDNGYDLPMAGMENVVGRDDLQGRIIVGRSHSGQHWMNVSGELASIKADGGTLILELANGQSVPLDEMVAALNPEEMVGKMAMTEDSLGNVIGGIVTGYEAGGTQVMLELDTGQRIALGPNTVLMEPE